jgi:hypothetical protein
MKSKLTIEDLATLVHYSHVLNSRNRCMDMCVMLFDCLDIAIADRHMYIRNGIIVKNGMPEEHHWVCIDGKNYDFTANQYVDTIMPLVWEGDVAHPYAEC